MISPECSSKNIVIDINRLIYAICLRNIDYDYNISVDLICVNISFIQQIDTNLFTIINCGYSLKCMGKPILASPPLEQ